MSHTCATWRAQGDYIFGGGRHLPVSSHHRWRGYTWQQGPTVRHAWSLSSAQSNSWGLLYRRWSSRSPTNKSPAGLSLESDLAMVYPSRSWWALSQTALPATAGSLSPYAGSSHPARTIAGQLLTNPSAVRPRNASGCRRTAPCLPSACTHQRLKKEGSNDAGGAHRTPHSHHRAVWWRFQNDVRCVRTPHPAVMRVHLPRKVKVRLSLNQTRWRPVKLYEFCFLVITQLPHGEEWFQKHYEKLPGKC